MYGILQFCSFLKSANLIDSEATVIVLEIKIGFEYVPELQVKCTTCSSCSNTYDPLLDLSLEINRADSLTKALNRFTAVEALEGDNEYHCANCQKKVRALKQFTIDKSPIILTIQFKRFSGTGSSGGKIDKNIDFGRTLAMKPYISNPQVNALLIIFQFVFSVLIN